MPSGAVIDWLVKSKSRRPPNASATTVSGEPMNDSVSLLPSLRAGKLRLKLDTIVLRVPFGMSSRFH